MKRLRGLCTSLAVILWCNICVGQQNLEKATIRSFLKEVLASKSYTPNNIKDKYMDLQPLADSMNTEKVNRQREQMFKKHLVEINKKYGALYDPVHTQILPFNELDSRQQIPFDKSITDHVYAVIFNSDKLMYIWVDGQKIKAFDLYIKKGEGSTGNAYFLGY